MNGGTDTSRAISDADLIREVNEAVAAGDLQRTIARLHPAVVWEHNLGGGTPEEGVYRGRDEVARLFERILEPWDYLRAVAQEVRPLGGGAYHIRGELHAKHSTSAQEIVAPYEQRLEIRDGLAVKCQMVNGPRATGTALAPARSEAARVVEEVVEAFRDRDVPRLRSLFDEQSVFESAITVPGGSTYRGLDEIERYMRDLDAVFEDWHSEDERYVEAGDDRVVLIYRVVGRGRESGVPVDRPIAIVWTVRDGKVVHARGYLDPDEALRSAGVAEPSTDAVEVARGVFEAFRRRDAAGMQELSDEEGEFRSAVTGVEGGSYRGHADIERYFSDLDEVFEDWHTEDERYLDAGAGRVVVVYRIVGRGRGSGIPIDRAVGIVFTVQNGKLRLGEAYAEAQQALEAAGLSGEAG